MNDYTKHIRISLVMTACLLVLLAASSVTLDPFQIFHDHLSSPNKYSTQQHYQIPGLIRKFLKPDSGYDSVIIGTCMMENCRPSLVSRHMGWGKTLPLSMGGGTPLEKRFVLEKSLASGEVANALVGIHLDYLNKDSSDIKKDFPAYLYTGLPLKYIFSIDTYKYSLYRAIDRQGWREDLETYSNWMDSFAADFRTFNRPENIQRLAARLSDSRAAPGSAPKAHAFPSIDEHLVSVIESHPGTRFALVLPPYSLAFFAGLPPADFNELMAMYEYLVRISAAHPNVDLYGFDNRFEVTGNLANYKTTRHYSEAVNTWMLSLMGQGKQRLTPANWPGYKAGLHEAAARYVPLSAPDSSLAPDLIR